MVAEDLGKRDLEAAEHEAADHGTADLGANRRADVGDGAGLSKGERTQMAILDAAIERFGRDGYRAASVAAIARDAGVGGTVTYAYYPNKESLFLAAVDEDAAGVIREGVSTLLEGGAGPPADEWRETLVVTLVEALERHPLAKRLLAGLEPEVTDRVLDVPALNDLRRACAARLRADQEAGTVRSDIDATTIANGIVAITLSLLTSIVQVGAHSSFKYADDVAAVFAAALDPPRA